jgi:hypothetical protein
VVHRFVGLTTYANELGVGVPLNVAVHTPPLTQTTLSEILNDELTVNKDGPVSLKPPVTVPVPERVNLMRYAPLLGLDPVTAAQELPTLLNFSMTKPE